MRLSLRAEETAKWWRAWQTEKQRLQRKDSHSLLWYCQTIRNTLAVFVPSSWHRAPKTLGISQVTEVREVSFVTYNKPLSTTQEFILRWLLMSPWTHSREGLVPEEPTTWLEGWHFQFPLQPLGKGDGLEVELITSDQSQWFHQSCLSNETSIKPSQMTASESFRDGEHVGCWEGDASGEGGEAQGPFPHILSHAALLSSCFWVVVFMIN